MASGEPKGKRQPISNSVAPAPGGPWATGQSGGYYGAPPGSVNPYGQYGQPPPPQAWGPPVTTQPRPQDPYNPGPYGPASYPPPRPYGPPGAYPPYGGGYPPYGYPPPPQQQQQQQSTTVVVNSGVDLKTGVWKESNELFCCFCNFASCIYAYCCPFCALGEGHGNVGGSCCCWCYWSSQCPCPVFLIGICQLRTKVREIRGIEGNCCVDCLLAYFCMFCSLVQSLEESKAIKAAGFARSNVNVSVVAVQQQQSMGR